MDGSRDDVLTVRTVQTEVDVTGEGKRWPGRRR